MRTINRHLRCLLGKSNLHPGIQQSLTIYKSCSCGLSIMIFTSNRGWIISLVNDPSSYYLHQFNSNLRSMVIDLSCRKRKQLWSNHRQLLQWFQVVEGDCFIAMTTVVRWSSSMTWKRTNYCRDELKSLRIINRHHGYMRWVSNHQSKARICWSRLPIITYDW
jgi:hypothetical protein